MGSIDDYLATLDPADAKVIGRCYDVARVVVPDATQGQGYGMPALTHRGKPLLSVMRARAHFGLYPFSARVIASLENQLGGIDHAKGTIRFQADAPLTEELLTSLVAARAAEIEA